MENGEGIRPFPTSCLQPSYNPCLAMAPQVHVLRGDGLAERRLTAEHVVARALVEASTFAEAVPRILEAICNALDWEHGALWDIDREADVLRCAEICTARVRRSFPSSTPSAARRPSRAASGCRAASGRAASRPGFPTSSQDANFPRAPVAAREGLHAAFGFPILLRGEVLSVMEFFSREIRAPDADLLSMLTSVGNQIGLFVDRRRAQEELDRFFTLSLDMLVHRRLRRLFQARQSGVAADPGLHRSGAAVAAVHGVRPSRRSRGHDGRRREAERPGTGGPLLREPLFPQGRHAALADVDLDAVPGAAGHLRRRARHHRAQGRRRNARQLRARSRSEPARARGPGGAPGAARQGAGDRQAPRRGGDRGEERLPRQHEPRDSHAAQRHPRDDDAGAADPAVGRAAGLPDDGEVVGRVAAGDHQRHPRLLEDRGAAARSRARRVRPARDRRRRGQAAGAPRRRKRHRARLPHRARRAARCCSAMPAGSARCC